MSLIKQYSRISHHTLTPTGSVFTVPTGSDFTDGTWTVNDLALSEFGVNEGDKELYIRIGDEVLQVITSGSSGLVSPPLSDVLSTGNTTGANTIEYSSDLSPSYTNRSVVDKEYVDGEITTNKVFENGTGSESITNIGDGSNSAVGSYSYTMGQSNTVNSSFSQAQGFGNTVTGIYGVAIGNNNGNNGDHTLSIGKDHINSGSYASVLGRDNDNNGAYNFLSGYQNSSTTGTYTTLLGRGNTSTATYGFTAGYLNTISATGVVALGQSNTGSASYGVAIGFGNTILSTYGIAMGRQNQAGNYGFAVGYLNNVSGVASSALGQSNTVSGNYSAVIGGNGLTNSIDYSVLVPNLYVDEQIIPSSDYGNTTTTNNFTFDCNVGMVQELDLQGQTGNGNLTITNPKEGVMYTLVIIQGSGLHDLFWPTAKWRKGSSEPVMSSFADNDTVKVDFQYINGTWYNYGIQYV